MVERIETAARNGAGTLDVRLGFMLVVRLGSPHRLETTQLGYGLAGCSDRRLGARSFT